MGNSKVPTDSLSRGSDTFTSNRLAIILKNERFSYAHKTTSGARPYSGVIYGPPEIRCQIDTGYFEFEEVDRSLRCFNNRNTKLRAVEFCRQLYGHDFPKPIAAAELDAMFSKAFIFKFEPLENSQTIIEKACDLLERMPAWPPELTDAPATIPVAYRASSVASNARKDARLWEQLQVTTHVSSTVLRAALSVVMDSGIGPSLLDMVNIIATMLEMVSQLAPTITDVNTLWRSFIVRTFLWTTWQRCQMIYFHLAATDTMTRGSLDGKSGQLTLRGTMPLPSATIHEIAKQCASLGKSAYMCGWNFELLRINPVCIGADFRRFHQLYRAAFDDFPARCFAGQPHACDGASPQNCQRFHGMVIEEQSAHDEICSRACKRLVWDECSYRSLSGPIAVCLMQSEGSANQSIQYRSASDQTLAISHVWSQ